MKYKIDVTTDDIRRGFPGNVFSCPVARALRRTTNSDDYGVVIRENLGYCVSQHLYEPTEFSLKESLHPLPESVRAWIMMFDHDAVDDTPFSFEIDLP
jgi:hypothetical protein